MDDISGRDPALVASLPEPVPVSALSGDDRAHGDLRVWWVPQVPMKAFEVDVPDLASAVLLLNTLGSYDAFQFEHNVKPDYCNMGGLLEFDAGVADWFEWECPKTFATVDELRRDPEALAQAIDARSGETGTGSIGAADESAVAKPCAQGPAA